MNQTIEAALAKYVEDQPDKWDQYIPGILFAYNTSVHDSTHYTPFEVMFGRKARLPVHLDTHPLEDEVDMEDVEGTLDVMAAIRKEIDDIVEKNIRVAQARQKRLYDLNHNSKEPFSVGMKVFLKNNRHVHRMGGKLVDRFLGPYKIAEELGKGRVKLMNIRTGKQLRNTYHCCNLKKDNTPLEGKRFR